MDIDVKEFEGNLSKLMKKSIERSTLILELNKLFDKSYMEKQKGKDLINKLYMIDLECMCLESGLVSSNYITLFSRLKIDFLEYRNEIIDELNKKIKENKENVEDGNALFLSADDEIYVDKSAAELVNDLKCKLYYKDMTYEQKKDFYSKYINERELYFGYLKRFGIGVENRIWVKFGWNECDCTGELDLFGCECVACRWKVSQHLDNLVNNYDGDGMFVDYADESLFWGRDLYVEKVLDRAEKLVECYNSSNALKQTVYEELAKVNSRLVEENKELKQKLFKYEYKPAENLMFIRNRPKEFWDKLSYAEKFLLLMSLCFTIIIVILICFGYI